MTLQDFKTHFSNDRERIPLNNSGQGPIPDVFRDVCKSWIDRQYTEGALCAMEGWAQTEVTRKKLAAFLGATPDETALLQTTATAISQAAFGIPLSHGDEVLTWDQEYPSNFYPWRDACKRAGARLIQVPSSLSETPTSRLLEHVTDRTKVIAISWVQYQAGAVTDLAEISRSLKDRSIWLVADVIQGVGVRPFHFHDSGFDVVCGGSHKFLCSGYGGGYMLIKKNRLAALSPVEVGAMTYGTPDTEKSFDIQPKANASRFEPGTKAMVEIIGLGATLDLLSSLGIEKIYSEASRLASKLADGLCELGFQVNHPAGPILNFSSSDKSRLEAVEHAFAAAHVSFAKRGPGIRLSTHAFNTDEQIMRALDIVESASPN